MNNPNSLVDAFLSQLQGAPLDQLSRQLGTDHGQTREAVGAALPMLMGALGRNASEPQGAQQLWGALQRDHSPAALGGGGSNGGVDASGEPGGPGGSGGGIYNAGSGMLTLNRCSVSGNSTGDGLSALTRMCSVVVNSKRPSRVSRARAA